MLEKNTNVKFLGSVEVNKDVSIHELRQMYSGVILAVGAQGERMLEIPGEEKYVTSAKEIVAWYNAEADQIDKFKFDFTTKRIATIVGNGNVAVDIARLMLRPTSHLLLSDMPDPVISAFNESAI